MNKKMLFSVFFSGLMLVTGTSSFAQTESGSLLKRSSPEETILQKLQQARPDVNFGQPRKSPFGGLYQVQISGGPVIFATADGQHFLMGDAYVIGSNGFERWQDPAQLEERKKTVASIDQKQTITFKPKTKTKSVVYVFTDVDCGYCRKLHAQMHAYTEDGVQKPGYNDLGIEVRYLAFPRAGIPSPSADKLISAWCAKDRQAALTKVKNNESIPNASCENPVAAQFELGGRIGVNATPALLLPDGSLELGYLPPEDMAKRLGI
jgi:thiol:disulfide interchange protein DsbC